VSAPWSGAAAELRPTPPSEAAGVRAAASRFAVRLASLLLLGTLFLTGPALSGEAAMRACTRWVPFWSPLGFHLNCDSPLFLQLANDPGGLFGSPARIRQSRPAYVALAAALTRLVRALFPALAWPLSPQRGGPTPR
jgi:hypothetical protein